jgi:hypothetical protein
VIIDTHLTVQLINSRLSMLGFVAALGAELATHQDIFTQVRTQVARQRTMHWEHDRLHRPARILDELLALTHFANTIAIAHLMR